MMILSLIIGLGKGEEMAISSDYRNRIFNEVPKGVKDSVNTEFTTAFDFRGNTLRIYKNGIRLAETNDYTLGDKNQIHFVVAPTDTDVLIADYDVVNLY